MDCKTFDYRLEDYLEEGLDFPGRFAMERHAQQCFRCGKTLADAQELRRIVRENKRVAAPPDFEAVLMRRIQTENLRPRLNLFGFRWPAWKLVTAGTLAVGLLVASALLLRTVPEKKESAAARPVAADPASANALSIPAPPVAAVMPEIAAKPKPAPGSPEALASDYPLESVDAPDYVEVMVPGPGDRMRVVRLPKTIRMRYGQPSEQYFIRNVSH